MLFRWDIGIVSIFDHKNEIDNNVTSNENKTQQPCLFHDQAMRLNAI